MVAPIAATMRCPRRKSFVQTPAARPQEVSFVIGIASSSSPKGIAVLKGPKTSSRQIRMSLQASRNIVGARKNYDRMGIHPIAYE